MLNNISDSKGKQKLDFSSNVNEFAIPYQIISREMHLAS